MQGDEFRSIAEQVPRILKPVADELGTTVGELKKFSAEGKITSAVVINALKKIEVEGKDALEALLKNDPTQVFKNLGNATEDLSRAFGDVLAPAVLPVIRGITQLTKIVTEFVNSGGGKVTLVFTAIGVALKGISFVAPLVIGQISSLVAQFQIATINAALASTGLKGVAASSFIAAGGVAKLNLALAGLKIALAKSGLGLAIVAVGALTAKFLDNKAAAEASAKAAKEFDDNLKGIVETAPKTEQALNSLAITQKEFELSQLGTNRNDKARRKSLEREIELLKDKQFFLDEEAKRAGDVQENNPFNLKTIEFMKSIVDLENQLSGKKQEQITLEEKIQAIKEEHGEEDSKQLIKLLKKEDSLKKQVEIMKEQKKAAEELKKKFDEIGQTVEDNLVQNLTDAVMGAKTLGQALSSVLRSLQRQLIELAISSALGGLGGIFGGFLQGIFGGTLGDTQGKFMPSNPKFRGAKAAGGPVKGGSSYIVGELGPELFTPSRSGMITPNHALGGTTNVVVNVDAAGSSVEGDDQSANKLGELIAAAVQSEIINQQMSGGLLS